VFLTEHFPLNHLDFFEASRDGGASTDLKQRLMSISHTPYRSLTLSCNGNKIHDGRRSMGHDPVFTTLLSCQQKLLLHIT